MKPIGPSTKPSAPATGTSPASTDPGSEPKTVRALLTLDDQVIFDSENPDAEGLEDSLYREFRKIFDAKRKARSEAEAAAAKK
jgi:hypothetical protein